MKKKRVVVVIVLVSVVMGVVALVGGVARSRCSVDPLSLRRWRWYSCTAPGVFKYCRVPIGTSESAIIKRFGWTTLTLAPNSAEWQSYVERRTRAGWSAPPRCTSGRVLVYEVVRGSEMIVVYYYLDGSSRLTRAFVSET